MILEHKFIDESEQQRDKLKTWQHSLEDNLLKLANQNKADATILELKCKEKLRLWKNSLEHNMQKIIEQHEQQKENFKTWQHGLEETLDLKTQEFMDQNKRQKGENELKVQDFIGQNKQQKEENEGWRHELILLYK